MKTDEQQMEEFFKGCLALFRSRNRMYGDSWKDMRIESIADHIRMKAYRTRELGIRNDKALDEAFDMANYAAMLFIKLKESKKL